MVPLAIFLIYLLAGYYSENLRFAQELTKSLKGRSEQVRARNTAAVKGAMMFLSASFVNFSRNKSSSFRLKQCQNDRVLCHLMHMYILLWEWD